MEIEEPQPQGGTHTENTSLKQAVIDISADLMRKQQANLPSEAVRREVDNSIARTRHDVPDFLMLSAKGKRRFQTGTAIEGVKERIAAAESFLNDTGARHSGLVTPLLPQHRSGTPSPVRTELLATLIVADIEQTKVAETI